MSELPPVPPPDDPENTGGGTPPPSPYGAGAAPPPPGGGFTDPNQLPYSATDAFGYGWKKFRARPSELLVPLLVVLVVVIVVEVVVQLLLRATLLGTHDCTREILGQSVQTQCGPGFVVSLLGSALGGFVVSLIVQAFGAGLIKNALNIADGKAASLDEVFAWAFKPQVITTAALVAGITFVGTLLCYVPGLIAAFLLNWSMFYVVDKGLTPVEAIRASVSFVTGHLSETLVFYLLGIVAFVVGAVLCLVGLLVAAPVVLIGAAYTFRRLHGEPVVPVTA